MSAEIKNFTGITKLDISADSVLYNAADKALTDVIVLGYDKKGREYFAFSMADGGSALWLLERAKKQLLDIPDTE